jgi:DNA-binding transcriptional regulator YdaS (Cro superfamily)
MNGRPEIIQDAIDKAGGLTVLARRLGLSPSTISEWARVPAERVIDVERLTGIDRTALRPDIYPQPPQVA